MALSRTCSKLWVFRFLASSCEAGKALQSTRTALNSEGLELAHIATAELQELGLVLHSRVSPVVLEELLKERSRQKAPASCC